MMYKHLQEHSASIPTIHDSYTAMSCSNVRYDFWGCGHILLDRCKVHAQDECLSCTCPKPFSTFSIVTITESCRKCQHTNLIRSHAQKVEALMREQGRLRTLTQKSLRERIIFTSVSPSAAKEHKRKQIACRNAVIEDLSQKNFSKTQHAKAELSAQCIAINRETLNVAGMDSIGTVINNDWILWFSGEQDPKLWTWDQQPQGMSFSQRG